MATLSTVISYGEPIGTIVTEIGTPGPTGQTGPQGPAGPTFTGGPITSPITYDAGTNSTAFENGDVFAQDNTSGSYGAIYTGGLQASNGDLTIDITGAGITFGDATFQTTAFPGSSAFYPSTGNPSGFLTAASLSGYATQSWVTSQGYATQSYVNSQGFITASALTPYLLSSTAASTYQTISGMSAYLSKAGNLSGLSNTATARTNLGLGTMATQTASNYLTVSAAAAGYYPLSGNPSGFLTDAPSDGSQYARQDGAWSVVTGGGGSFLPLAGGTMTGPIVFDGTSGQYISKGNFDTARGGNYGISLVCSIGYEFNWQAGWLTTTNQNSVTPRPLYLDSLAGTTLRSWDSETDTGTEVAHSGINVGNTSPYYVNVAPDMVKVFEATNELGVTIAHDSIAIQHIDTPDQTAYFTNEYIGFEDMGATPHSAFVEHDVITVQNETANTAVRAESVIITQGDSTASLGISAVNFVTPIANGYIGANSLGIDDYVNNQTLTAAAAYVRLQTPGLDPGLVKPQAYLTASALNFQFEDEVPAATYAATGITFPDSTVQTTAYTGGGGGGASWGSITGTLSSQTDLQTALDSKVGEAPQDNVVYGRVDGVWVPIPGTPTYTLIATGYTSIAGWLFSGTNIYLGSNGNVIADTPGSANGNGSNFTINGSDTAGATLDLSSFTGITNPIQLYSISSSNAPILPSSLAISSVEINGYSPADLPSAIFGYSGISYLTITSANNITSVPSLSGISSLQGFTLDNCASITSAPDFTGLTSLTSAYVNGNASMTSAPSFSGCTSLYNAEVHGNTSMTSAPSFSGCTSLNTASVYSNASMTSAPDFSGLTALTTANVSENTSMTSAPDFTGLTSLTSAYVNGNASMTSAPSFSGCTSLYTAEVHGNISMTSAPDFTGLTSLYNAYVYGNTSMTSAPDFTGVLLYYVNVYGCAITNCTDILDQLDANGRFGGYCDISGGTNESIDPAYGSLLSLQSRGWTVVFNSL